jgi:hypothetical protein
MRYSIGQDLMFIILALISSLALLSEHLLTATVFFALSILFIIFEHQAYDYVNKP